MEISHQAIAEKLLRLDPAKRRILGAELRKKGIDPLRLPIPHLGGETAPLSATQERLWILEQLEDAAGSYNEPYRGVIDGPFDFAAMCRAFAALVERHAILRTHFERRGGAARQVIGAPSIEPPELVDLGELPEAERARRADAIAREVAAEPFDLARPPLYRVLFLRWGVERHEMLLNLHHILCDAASIGLLAADLSALYRAEIGQGEAPPPPSIGFADYARWQRELYLPSVLDSLLDAWQERLQGAPTVLALPTDHPRSTRRTSRGKRIARTFPPRLSEAIKALGRRAGTTSFMTLTAVFGVLLGRYTGRRDLLIGSPIDGRDRAELAGLVGFFVNTLVLRIDLHGDPTGLELLERVRRMTLDAYQGKEAPFAEIVERLRPERSPSHPPLVQVMLVVQRAVEAREASDDFRLGLRRIDNETAKFDLTMVLREQADGLECGVEFNTDLFEDATIERLMGHFEALLEGFVTAPERRVTSLPMLSGDEVAALDALRGEPRERPVEQTADALFADRAAQAPDVAAVVCGDAVLSYGELDRRANRLAHRLRELGVGAETRVGLAMEHRPEMLVGLLGILKAGGAYVPLDPAYPEERLRFLVEDSGVEVLVTQETLLDGLPSGPRPVLFDAHADVLAAMPETPPRPLAGPGNMAYQIYTSGSTGRPKGVMVEHRSLINLTWNFIEIFRLGPHRRMLMFLSLAFDASIGDIYPPLLSGGTVVLHPVPSGLSGGELERLCEEHRIHALELAAAFWSQWVEELGRRADGRMPSALDTLVVGGDSIHLDKLADWFALAEHPVRVLHNYGPTEATVCTTSKQVEKGEESTLAEARLTIGVALPNTDVRILDPRGGQALPFGVPGELCIGGIGVARGYLGRPAVTAQVFVPDPFAETPGARLYRTGDLARRRADGEIEFLGRIDHQVKVRGFRIEPGEIEAALSEHPRVAEVAVIAREVRPGHKDLVAYLAVDDQGDAPTVSAVRQFLLDRLPEHMVPSTVVFLDTLPLNTHGKVDRDALPEPDSHRPELDVAMQAPRNLVEAKICEVWREVLGLDEVGVMDNFFDLGGTSLLLLEAQARLGEVLERQVKTVDLFRYPTIEGLAEFFARAASTDGADGADGADGELGTGASGDRQGGKPSSPDGAMDIAVVGMSGRFPGAASVEALWELLRDGVEGIGRFDLEELRGEGYGAMVDDPRFVPAQGSLEGVDLFDARFFGFSALEAKLLDPQHRLFLEHAWEALENAGYDPDQWPGRIGVFAGVGRNRYFLHNLQHNPRALRAGAAQLVFGNDKDFFPTRVSYKLGLRGPSMVVQTACSTSLVATHMGCQSLLVGDSDMVLVGGVTISVPARGGYLHETGGIFSSDGHCRPFDARAEGTVPGNGVGVVVLKRLVDALRDGDTIRAVIKATAINNDGSEKVGYTAPGVDGQVDVIRRALDRARLAPTDVSYVETHGTGTALGDLIEITALREAYGPGREPASCPIGALKSNVGHMDAAAGIGGLIKAVLALEHEEIPPTLHFETPNPKLGLPESPFFVADRRLPWRRGEASRRAGVSSFGIGGTNVHVILEEAPAVDVRSDAGPDTAHLLVVSARSREALDATSRRLADALEADGAPSLADVAHTLRIGRRALPFRRRVVCRDRRAAIAALRAPGDESVRDQFCAAAAGKGPTPSSVFLFAGIGAQYLGMGRGLYDSEPVFRRELDRCAEIARPLLDPSAETDLRRVIFAAEDTPETQAAIRRTWAGMPALVAVQYALARLFMAWGIRPSAMIGHSLGEYTAACLAGVMSLEDTFILVAARGRLFETLPRGAMLSVGLSADEAASRLPGEISIASINQPDLCVVSGPVEAVDVLERSLVGEGVECRRVFIDVACHSPMVAPILDEFGAIARSISTAPPRVPLISNLTGTWMPSGEALDPGYWVEHLRSTVRFTEGLGEFTGDPSRIFLEVSPGRTLSTFVRSRLALDGQDEGRVVASMRHPRQAIDDREQILRAVGDLWAAGLRPDWRALGEGCRRVPLPATALERKRYWIDPPPSRRAADLPAGIFVPSRGDAGASVDRSGGFVVVGAGAMAERAVDALRGLDLDVELRGVPRGDAAELDLWRDLLRLARGGGPPLLVVSPGAAADDEPEVEEFDADPAESIAADTRARVAPRDDVERTLVEIWQDLLGFRPIGIHDDYYELGGHSLLAIRIVARVAEELGVELSMDAVLEEATVAGMAERLRTRRGAGGPPPIGPMPRDGEIPLSFIQEEVWRNRFEPGGVPPHNAAGCYRGRGAIDVAALERALNLLAERHAMLRTTLPTIDGRPVQRIAEKPSHRVPLVDLQALDPADFDGEIARIGLDSYCEELDPVHGPLITVIVLRIAADDHVVMRSFDRLGTDGASLRIFTQELMALYEGCLEGRRATLPELPLAYADFALWQRNRVDGPFLEAQMAGWLERLQGVPTVLALPTKGPRPARLSIGGGRVPLSLDPAVGDGLRALARGERATLFHVLLALYKAALHRISGQSGIFVASPISERVDGTEGIIGRFLNTLALYTDLSGAPSFRQLVERVRGTANHAFARKELPYERLVDTLCGKVRDPGRRPLCQVAFLLHEVSHPEFRLGGVELESFWVNRATSEHELTLSLFPRDSGAFEGFYEFQTDLFDHAVVETWAADLRALAARVVEDPDLPLTSSID